MGASEFQEAYTRLVEEFELKKRVLSRDYALSNNSVKVGDIIKSARGSILVDEVRFIVSVKGELPACSYWGRVLTRAGVPRKDGSRLRIHQKEVL